MHSGHRERMRKKFLSGGQFPDHEVLEMLLAFSIPRRNTNDIAHRLLATFDTLDGVFAADYDQLLKVRGVGPQSAFQIKLIARVRNAEDVRADEGGIYLNTVGKLGAYAVELFAGMEKEAVYAVLMTGSLRVTDCVCLSGGGYYRADVDVTRLLASPWLLRSSTVAILHNHPDGALEESEEDREFVARISELLAMSGITVIENILVSGDRYRPLMQNMQPVEGAKSEEPSKKEGDF